VVENTISNRIRCVRCAAKGDTRPYTHGKVTLVGRKKIGWTVTSTYRTGVVSVPVCSNCAVSFSQWEKSKRLRNKLFLISLVALLIVVFVGFIIGFIGPLMDSDPFTQSNLSFENFILVIPILIVSIALGIATSALNSSESNPNIYIKIGQKYVLISPINSKRLWNLEEWNRIITEEQIEAEKLYFVADQFQVEGNYIEAIKFYNKALELFPEYPSVIHDKRVIITKLKQKVNKTDTEKELIDSIEELK